MEHTKGAGSLAFRLEALLAPQVLALGYDLLDLEYQSKSPQGGPLLRIFIDFPGADPTDTSATKIGLEDCVKVDKGLDPFFESSEFSGVLPAGFTLEVSSPGLDRPLKQKKDFEKYKNLKAQIKTFRPISIEEMGNPKYFEHHQKQKNFLGILLGMEGDSVLLESDNEKIKIPFEVIAKANLDIASTIDLENE